MDRDRVRDLPVPAGPVKRIVRAMFGKPIELEEEVSQLLRFLNELQGVGPDRELGEGNRPEHEMDLLSRGTATQAYRGKGLEPGSP